MCKPIAFRGLPGADTAFRALYYHFQVDDSSATREILLDCFAFDPQKWAAGLVTDLAIGLDLEWGVGDY